MESFFQVYDWLVLGILVYLLITALLNILSTPTLKVKKVKASLKQALPKVSVLIPARNEAHQIAECVHSLKDQSYGNLEVLVLDDCSEDGTIDQLIASGFTENLNASFRFIRGQSLPQGWAGKPWACYQLSRQATGDYFLFTDADTVHERESVESAVKLALERQTHLLSVWPHQITETWSERLVIPVIYLLGMALLPLWFLNLAQRSPKYFKWVPKRLWKRLGAANGQYLLFTRDAYKQLGSHQLVKDHLVEDVALGQALAARVPQGWRLLNCDGRHIVNCRMYREFAEVWEGFSKNARPAFENRSIQFVIVGLLLWTTLVMPFLWLMIREERWLVSIQVQLILLLRLLVTVRFETSWLSLIFHPLSIIMALAIGLNSWWLSLSGRITWKQRQYEWNGSTGVGTDSKAGSGT